MLITEFARDRLKDLDNNEKLKDQLKREIMFLETISVYNQPDLSGDFDELVARLEQEDNIIIDVNQYNRLVSKANKYDQLKRALRDD